jgi:protein-L-isoaspartate(D-aspartate) O-methyltransferase
MADAAEQRRNMVESQVRPSDVTDRRVIRAMSEVERERFVPRALRAIAYMDQEVPLAAAVGRRALLAPRTFAKLIQAAEIGADAAVLDVGAATGYSSAVLARLAARVVALESDPDLAEEARRALPAAGVTGVALRHGPLGNGSPEDAPFDVIVLEGAVPEVPARLLDQLKDGGRLVAILSDGRWGRATVWRRIGTSYDARPVFDAGALPLPGFAREAQFQF